MLRTDGISSFILLATQIVGVNPEFCHEIILILKSQRYIWKLIIKINISSKYIKNDSLNISIILNNLLLLIEVFAIKY